MVHLTEDNLVLGKLYNGKAVVQLTRHEMAIFFFLSRNAAASWEAISQYVWGDQSKEHIKTLSVHFFNMRKKVCPKFKIVHNGTTKTYSLQAQE